MYTYCVLPARVAFGDTTAGPFFFIDLILDVVFLFDIALNFCTGFIEKGEAEMDFKEVRNRYLLTYFFVDLSSAFPTEALYFLITAKRSRDLMIAKYLRLFRMGRYFRIRRFLSFISPWQDQLGINSNLMRMFKLVLLIILFSHLNACVQFFVAEIEGFPPEGWVHSNNLQSASIGKQYTFSLFKGLSHMLCIGYGQVAPVTLPDIWATIFSMVVGASFYIFLFGIMSALMLSVDRSRSMYEEKMNIWQEYFNYTTMPRSLRHRILSYLNNKYSTRKMFDEAELMSELPSNLRMDVQTFMCEDLIMTVPLFKACRLVVVRTMAAKMSKETYAPGDCIFLRGEPIDFIYFILRGEVQIESEEGNVITCLSSGSYFGEFGVLGQYRGDLTAGRMATARAVTNCDVFTLSCANFKTIADTFPEVVELLESTAVLRSRVNEYRD